LIFALLQFDAYSLGGPLGFSTKGNEDHEERIAHFRQDFPERLSIFVAFVSFCSNLFGRGFEICLE
jgi:hypothetical protein